MTSHLDCESALRLRGYAINCDLNVCKQVAQRATIAHLRAIKFRHRTKLWMKRQMLDQSHTFNSHCQPMADELKNNNLYILNSNISKQDFYSVLSYVIFVVCSFPLSYLEQNEI